MKKLLIIFASLISFNTFAIDCTFSKDNKSNRICKHYIGEYFGGGVVFYVDHTGEHGLIAALNDSTNDGSTITWGVIIPYGKLKDGIGAGKFNTDKIIDGYNVLIDKCKSHYCEPDMLSTNFAAYSASKTKDGGYNDWYLPSRFELQLIMWNKDVVPNLIGDYDFDQSGHNSLYWSSSTPLSPEIYVISSAWDYVSTQRAYELAHVRAVRQF